MLYDHFRSDRHAAVKVDDIRIGETEAAGRHGVPDRLRLVGAVNAIFRMPDVERAGTQRIAGPSGHEAGQIRLPFDHLGRRAPVRPLRLAGDPMNARPLKADPPDPDPIADGAVVALNHIKKALRRADDDGTHKRVKKNLFRAAPRLGWEYIFIINHYKEKNYFENNL